MSLDGQLVRPGVGGPDVVVDGPTPMPWWVLWPIVVVAIVGTTVVMAAAPLLIGSLVNDDARTVAGAVTFIPADGWEPVPNPPLAPASAVTVGRDGATYSVWSQGGDSDKAAAHAVANAMFPQQMAEGRYLQQDIAPGWQIRPELPNEVSLVQAVALDQVGSAIGGPAMDPGDYAISASAGPPESSSDQTDLLWQQVDAMNQSLEPVGAR